MNRKFGLTAVAALLVAAASPVQAQQWFDGGFAFVPGLACVTWNAETAVTTYAGYWGTMDTSFPVVGDTTYVHGVGAVVGNPCSGGDVIDFQFFFPPGTALAISPQNPVICVATRLSDGLVVTSDPSIHCSQTQSVGAQGGWSFGWATVPRGWVFEVRVPVRFTQPLVGMAASTHKVQVVTTTVEGTALVEGYVTAPYRALVNYPTPSATYLSTPPAAPTNRVYRLSGYVYNYFTAGTLSLEAGTAPGSLSAIGGTNASIPATGNGFQATWDLTVVAGFTYYWRAVFTSASGTFYGPVQSFTASTANSTSHLLTVTRTGTGSGTIRSNPQGIDCGSTCFANFTAGTAVQLTASPGPGSQFNGWSGACSGTGACTASVNGATSVTASFGPAPVPTIGSLDIIVNGPAGVSGGFTSVTGPGGFNSSYNLLAGTGASLSNVPPGEYLGTAKLGSKSGSADVYVPRPAVASAAVLAGSKGTLSTTYTLGRSFSASNAGGGSGTVTSSPNGLSCGATCTAWFADAEQVTLTATPNSGSTFTGWTVDGIAAGSANPLALTATANKTIVATYAVASGGGGGGGGCGTGGAPSLLTLLLPLLVLRRRRADRDTRTGR